MGFEKLQVSKRLYAITLFIPVRLWDSLKAEFFIFFKRFNDSECFTILCKASVSGENEVFITVAHNDFGRLFSFLRSFAKEAGIEYEPWENVEFSLQAQD